MRSATASGLAAFALASAALPVTIPVNDHLRLNRNAGWQYLRFASTPDDFFWGAQVEAKVGGETTLMLETFGRARGAPRAARRASVGAPTMGRSIFDFLVGASFD